MKKIAFLIIAFTLLAAAVPSFADSVWMPMDDFFSTTWNPENDNTCEYQKRPYYLAAGEKGYVTSVKTPLDQTRLATYPNGTEFKITYICGSGRNLWGTVEAVRMNGETAFSEIWGGTGGYIYLADLARSYDSDVFTEIHKEEIKKFDESVYDICSGNEFVLWTAPYSHAQVEYVSSDYISWICMVPEDADYRMYSFGGYYVDPDGRRWVEATLRQAWEHGWFCLDSMTEGGVKTVY